MTVAIRQPLPGGADGRPNRLLDLGPCVDLGATGLRIPRALPLTAWQFIGTKLLAVAESSTWWVADWAVYGESTYEDRYRELIARTSLDYQTLRNYSWVARRFDPARRRAGLSFAHHAEVAALEVPEQEFWLRKAEEHAWSRNRLRREVRGSRNERQQPAPSARHAQHSHGSARTPETDRDSRRDPDAEELRLTASPAQLARFREHARSSGLSLESWALRVLDAAVGNSPR